MVDSKSKKRLLIVTVILLAIIGYMIYSSSAANYSYFKKISEVASDSSLIGKSVRVGGKILKGSVVQDGSKYTFKIYEKQDKLTIIYDSSKSGPLPSTFGAGVMAIVEGKLISNDKLEAKSMVTQCPSKYKSKDKAKKEVKKEAGGE